jgi:predicted lipoprotein with Yx(FWY)xxD motif
VKVAAAATCGLLLFVVACSSPGAAGQRTAVRTIDVPGPGRVLGDGGGYALYVYVPDNQGASTCYGVCAKAWPPLVLSPGQREARAEPGVKKALLGTTRRTNGELQVTYNGWPLYLYIGDSAGQATGQALDMGTWYLISPTGMVDEASVESRGG